MPNSDPIWLQNMEMELTLASAITESKVYTAGPNAWPPFTPGDTWRYDRWSVTLAILKGYTDSIDRWLNREHVKGSARVQRVYAHYQQFCDWARLDGPQGDLQPLLAVVTRLRGLQ
jgi:hypothetical protein